MRAHTDKYDARRKWNLFEDKSQNGAESVYPVQHVDYHEIKFSAPTPAPI